MGNLWIIFGESIQADVEVGAGGIKQNCSLVESIQVKAVLSAFSMRFTDIGLYARPWIIKMERRASNLKAHEYKNEEHECKMNGK